MVGGWLDQMMLEIFPNLNDSMIILPFTCCGKTYMNTNYIGLPAVRLSLSEYPLIHEHKLQTLYYCVKVGVYLHAQ